MYCKPVVRVLCCLLVVCVACGTMMAQGLKVAPKPTQVGPITPYRPSSSDIANANVTIFSNLGPTTTNMYNAAAGGYYVCGTACAALATDQWIGVQFYNKAADHATTLQAAIGYDSGTKKVILGLYTDNAGVVGTMLAQATATRIPNTGTCCQVVQVTIPSTALTAGTNYWVVASADDTTASDFEGVWQASNQANIGGDVSQGGWFTFSGLVPAFAVKGTNP